MRLRRFERYWDRVGRRAPLQAVLTDTASADVDVDRFFASGRDDAARFVTELDAVAPRVRRGRVLDFGCGVGRVSRALAGHFESVVGVDVAASMVARARELNRSVDRCRFELNRAPHLHRFADASFDVVYSRLVLQHLSPPLVRGYIRELIRVLAPAGVLMFQLPDVVVASPEEAFVRAPVTGAGAKRHLPGWMVRLYRRFKYRVLLRSSVRRMEMFGLPRDEVIAIVTAAGGTILDVRDDRSHGTPGPGYAYWVTKP